MLMNIVNLMINQWLGKAANAEASPGIFPMLSRANLRKILMIFAGLSVGLLLLFGGFFTVLTDLILTSRERQQLMLSPASIVGFSMIGISMFFMFGLFSRKVWKMAPQHQPQSQTLATSPVQEAMAELIRDFVEERRLSREMALEQLAAQASSMDPGAIRSETEHEPSQSAYN